MAINIKPSHEGKFHECADSDEAGQVFRFEAGHPYRFEVGHCTEVMSARLRRSHGSMG